MLNVERVCSLPISYFLKDFIYSFERVHEQGAGRGRRGEGGLQADSVLSIEPDMGLDLPTLRLQPEQKSRVGHLRHLTNRVTQAPLTTSYFKAFSIVTFV